MSLKFWYSFIMQKTIATHSGCFHADDAMACMMLAKYTKEFKDPKIIRTRENEIIEKVDLVVDVGGVYDPNTNRYDHHQKSFEETFSD